MTILSEDVSQQGPIMLISQSIGEDSINYPQLYNMANLFVQDQVNNTIQEAICFHIDLFQTASTEVPANVQISTQYYLFPSRNGHDLLSILFSVTGRMPNGRSGHRLIPLVFDLGNGKLVASDELFYNVAEARGEFESIIMESLADELSIYLDIDFLVPFPIDRFFVTPTGITFAYPDNSLIWLSGRSASLHFLFNEILPLLKLDEDGLLMELSDLPLTQDRKINSAFIRQYVDDGKLPGINLVLGDDVERIIADNPLLHDPEGFPNGEKYQLEDDTFRGTVLISQDRQFVNGIFSKRIEFFGMLTGDSKRAEIIENIGTPVVILPLTEDAARMYGVSEGQMDVYQFSNVLRLFYDKDEVLTAIWLQQITSIKK